MQGHRLVHCIAERDTTSRAQRPRSSAGTLVAVEVYANYAPFVFPEAVGSTLVCQGSFDKTRLIDLIAFAATEDGGW